MILDKRLEYWESAAIEILRKATTEKGIKASCTETSNYGAIFTRDAVMTGIAGLLYNDPKVINGFRATIENLNALKGFQGQIASNFEVENGQVKKVSFGTLSPKIDSATWYLIGIGLLSKNGYNYDLSYIEPTINLLEALEYNGKNLMYIPEGGNWADEYPFEGYILYDQILRSWALQLLGECFERSDWIDKSLAIQQKISSSYFNPEKSYYNCSFTPSGNNTTFDFAAHCMLGILQDDSCNPSFASVLAWIKDNFTGQGKLPGAFYPVIQEEDEQWKSISKFHLFDFKNKPYHYHNGGIWPIWIGWFALVLQKHQQQDELQKLADYTFHVLDTIPDFNFDEYFTGDTNLPGGTTELCYTATGILFLCKALRNKAEPTSLLTYSRYMDNIKEDIHFKDEYLQLTKELAGRIKHKNQRPLDKIVIAIGGESGSGKSTTSYSLLKTYADQGIAATCLHMDSYFKLPPQQNHGNRLVSLENVGLHEVNISLLNEHISLFKNRAKTITIPVVDYKNNSFSNESQDLENVQVLIVEGVYSFSLNNIDYKVFMDLTYRDTLKNRAKRSREVYDPFVENVLEIEHKIVRPMIDQADYVIDKNYDLCG